MPQPQSYKCADKHRFSVLLTLRNPWIRFVIRSCDRHLCLSETLVTFCFYCTTYKCLMCLGRPLVPAWAFVDMIFHRPLKEKEISPNLLFRCTWGWWND